MTNTADGTSTKAAKTAGTSKFGNQRLLAAFSVDANTSYEVTATGAPVGTIFNVSEVSSTAVLSILGKGFGAFGVAGVAGVLALIFGIIGLVKYFGSKNAAPPAMPPAR